MEALALSSQLGRDEFLHLLVTQLRNQNPLDPIKDGEFIAQLAQFSTLEGLEKLNAKFEDLLTVQQLTQGADLIGRTALYGLPDGSASEFGVVHAVGVRDGNLHLIINGTEVPLDLVRSLIA